MAKVEGLERLILSLRDRARRHPRKVELGVGFSAPHAVKIHEDLQMFHANGQAKYLETPARAMELEIAQIAAQQVRNGKSMREGLGIAGTRLLEAAQALVPVDTERLRESGFVRVESETP